MIELRFFSNLVKPFTVNICDIAHPYRLLTSQYESAKLRGLHSNVGYVGPRVAWVAWIKFLRGSTCYVGHNFYVGCVGQIYFCMGQNFLRGSIFLRVSKLFVWVKKFLRGSKFFRGSIFLWWVGKVLDLDFHNNILVVH